MKNRAAQQAVSGGVRLQLSSSHITLQPSVDSTWSRIASVEYEINKLVVVIVLEFNLDFKLYTVTRETFPNYRTYFFLRSSMIEPFLIES